MKINVYKAIMMLIVALQFFLTNCIAQEQNNKSKDSLSTPAILTKSSFQDVINNNYKIIETYYSKLSTAKGIPKDLTNQITLNRQKIDSISKLLDYLLGEQNKTNKEISSKINTNKSVNYEGKKKIDQKVAKKINEIKYLKLEQAKLENYKTLQFDIIKLKSKFDKSRINIQNESIKLSGEGHFIYNNEEYYFYVSNLKYENINSYVDGPDLNGKFRTTDLKHVQNILIKNKIEPLMITNAGMYHSSGQPVGLLVMNKKLINPLNTGGPSHLNFYLLPNGIFFIKNDTAHIMETKRFDSLIYRKKIILDMASQSGPMLVVNGKHHPKFNYGSKSLKLRSGVGVMPNGKVVFIISKNNNTNFFQFATIFKDVFGCDNALFLDGVISKMYLKNIRNGELGGNFGPVIYITKK